MRRFWNKAQPESQSMEALVIGTHVQSFFLPANILNWWFSSTATPTKTNVSVEKYEHY